jgi:hypothetical protein
MPKEEELGTIDSSKVVRGSSQARERSEGEIKVTGGDIPLLRQREGSEPGKAPGTQPVTAKGRGGSGEDQRPATRYEAGDTQC